MATASFQNGTQQHVPAWKRLGLKLKNARTEQDDQENASLPEQTLVRDSKKRKSSQMEHLGSGSHDYTFPEDKSSTTTTGDRPLKRKKSVTFAANAKQEDGDANDNLLAAFVNDQKGEEGQFSTKELSAFLPSETVHSHKNPSTETNAIKNPILKPKKEKTKQKHSSSEEPLEPEFIRYLQQYHTSRASWRFNKANQIKLIKNIFNIYRIPEEHDAALSSYLAGLQGDSARQRLVESAKQVLNQQDLAPVEDMSGSSDIDAAKAKALKSQLKTAKSNFRAKETAAEGQSDDYQALLRKRKRAALVLRSLEPKNPAFAPEPGLHSPRSDKEDPPKKRRRSRRSKKTRTGVPDDDDTDETSSVSSVSSSSVSSDSASNDEDGSEGDSGESEDSTSEPSAADSSTSGSEDLSSSEDSSDSDTD